MTGANIDRLLAAGITTIKQRQHEGLTHMKTLITSNIALNASSNFTANWERDHNYFIPAQTKPALHAAFKNRFNAMWTDGDELRPVPTAESGSRVEPDAGPVRVQRADDDQAGMEPRLLGDFLRCLLWDKLRQSAARGTGERRDLRRSPAERTRGRRRNRCSRILPTTGGLSRALSRPTSTRRSPQQRTSGDSRPRDLVPAAA